MRLCKWIYTYSLRWIVYFTSFIIHPAFPHIKITIFVYSKNTEINYFVIRVNIEDHNTKLHDQIKNKIVTTSDIAFDNSLQCLWSGFSSLHSPKSKVSTIEKIVRIVRADFRLSPGQWETSLESNAVSHWPRTNLESELITVMRLHTWWSHNGAIYMQMNAGDVDIRAI